MMLRIICVLVILGANYGHLTQEDGWKQTLHRVRRIYASQNQNDKSVPTENSLKLHHSFKEPVFGTRLKHRVKIYFDYPIDTNKSTNHTHTLLRRLDDQNTENSSATGSREYSSTDTNSKLSEYKLPNTPLNSDAVKSKKSHNLLDSGSKNSLEIYDLQISESESFGNRVSRDYYENNKKQNVKNKNVDELKNNQNLSGTKSNQKPKSLLSFRSRNGQNGKYNGYGWKQIDNPLKASLRQILYPQNSPGNQKTFETNCNAASNTLFLRKPGSNSVNITGQIPFKAPDYLPPVDKTTTNKGQDYLPPNDSKKPCSNGKPSITTFTTTKRPNTSTTSRHPLYTIDTITKHPYHYHSTTRPTTNLTATTKKPYYIPFDKQRPIKRPFCHACSSNSGPFYVPFTKPPTTIPKTDWPGDSMKSTTSMTTITTRPVERGDVPVDDDTPPSMGAVAPAMAMTVPIEPYEPVVTTTMSPTTTMSSSPSATTTTTEITNVTTIPMTMETPFKRDGDPALAMRVPAEPDEVAALIPPPSTSITPVSSPPLMVSITPSMTINTIQTIPTDDNRHLLEESGSATTMITETMTTTDPTRKEGGSASIATLVPPEAENPNSIPPLLPTTTTLTTTSTTPTTSMSTNMTLSTTLSYNRHLLEEELPTINNMTQMTTPRPYRGPQYLPPKIPTRQMPTFNTTSSDPAPAMAMPVPPEPDPSPRAKPTSTPADSFRAAEPSNTTTTSPHNPFKAPEYLPPKIPTRQMPTINTTSSDLAPAIAMLVPPEPDPSSSTKPTSTPESFRAAEPSNITTISPAPTFPKPAMAMPVKSEPECSLDSNDVPDIDQRSLIKDPCLPTKPKSPTKTAFKGPSSLPPLAKFRVERSSNKTLRLGELAGTPRPVWYAGIYKKTTKPYKPICGGSIVREDVVISAAHCFWDDSIGQQSATLFAVAARKIYKPYNDPMDKEAQKSDVLDIKIPPRFLGAKTSFQEDLAILKLRTSFTFSRSVYGLRPICVDFDVEFDRQQLRSGHYGTVAGWGYTDAAGTLTQRLLWLELPYVEIEKCIRDSEDDFLKYITSDKVCAGENDTGKALCRGDSGGGLAFWQGEPGHATPYLRGIASTAPATDAQYASFTHVLAHRTFLRDHVPDIENCRFWG